jgi:phosphate transport system ATP-binding protein
VKEKPVAVDTAPPTQPDEAAPAGKPADGASPAPTGDGGPVSPAVAPRVPIAVTLGQPDTTGGASRSRRDPTASGRLDVEHLDAMYGTFRAIRDISFEIPPHTVTAIIGPSGCGKSTFLRTLNRMHELVAGATVKGAIRLDGVDIYGPDVDPVRLRRVVGMVFQRPNPFPTMTIYDNVAAGLRLTGRPKKADLDVIVERSLRRAALWDEVKDKLRANGTSLSGGQQQRLCIARALAVGPEVLLMDEPASSLDPIATLRIEELIAELKQTYTIVIVTHNMQQAARVSDRTAFFTMGDERAGYLVEVDDTARIFTNPKQRLTEDYVSGRFG